MKPIIIDHKKAFNHTFGEHILVLPTKFAKEMLDNKICDIKSGKNTFPICYVKFINYPYLDDGNELETYISVEAINVIEGDEEHCLCYYFIPAVKKMDIVMAQKMTLPAIKPWSIEKMEKSSDTDVAYYPLHDYPFHDDCDMSISFRHDKARLKCMECFEWSVNKSSRYFCHELTSYRFVKLEEDGEEKIHPVVRLKNYSGHIEYYAWIYRHTSDDLDRVYGGRTYLLKEVPKDDVYMEKAPEFFSKPFQLTKYDIYGKY